MDQLLWTIVAVASAIGLGASLYVIRFTGLGPATPSSADAACSLTDPGKCATLFQLPTARLIKGIPNASLGLIFYTVTLVTAMASFAWSIPPIWVLLLLAGAIGACVMSVVLAYRLLFVLKVPCVACFIGHGSNLVLLGLLIRLRMG
ncbi:MAG: vitamin K epoxide reductase family protein [bacterium]